MFGIKSRSADFGAIEIVVLCIFIEPALGYYSGTRQLPASRDGTEELQERDGACGCRFHVVRESGKKPVGGFGKRCNSFTERVANHNQSGMTCLSELCVQTAHLRQHDIYG